MLTKDEVDEFMREADMVSRQQNSQSKYFPGGKH